MSPSASVLALASGFGLILAGVAFIYWPAVLIVAGLALLGAGLDLGRG